MWLHTAIAEPASVRLEVFPSEAGRAISTAKLTGTNLALWHEPREVYRDDFLAAVRAWGPGLLRIPGGSWSNEYFWNGNGVRRPDGSLDATKLIDGQWQIDYSAYAPGFRVHGEEYHLSDYHGVLDVKQQHEFAEALGVPQVVTVNMGSGTPEMAVEWMKFARANGYNVAFWEVGNELNGEWELGHFLPDGTPMDGTTYAKLFREFATAMKAFDPDAKIGGPACSDLELAFVEEFIRDAGDIADFISIHAYPVGVQLTDRYEQFRQVDLLRKAMQQIDGWIAQYQPERVGEIAVGVTEWNMKVNEDRDTADLVNGLWSAAWIGVMAETGIDFANQWDLLTRTAKGGHAAFRVAEDGSVTPKSHYWAQYIWQNLMGDELVRIELNSTSIYAFATRDTDSYQLMLINPSPTQQQYVQINIEGFAASKAEATGYQFSRTEYFWDPHSHRPVWSEGPYKFPIRAPLDRDVQLAPESMLVMDIPLKRDSLAIDASAMWKPDHETSEVLLRLILPESAPFDLPLEGWLLATSGKHPARGFSMASTTLSIEPRAEIEMVNKPGTPTCQFYIRASKPGAYTVTATDGQRSAKQSVLLEAVEERQEVYWTFDNPIADWNAESSFILEMEPSVKPNEYVASSAINGQTPGANADILMSLTAMPQNLPKARIGGVVGELKVSRDFSCDDPDARVNIVLQSEADHWMVLGGVPVADMRRKWNHFRFSLDDPRKLEAMNRLYAMRFQLESTSKVKGHVYMDNIGFILRSE